MERTHLTSQHCCYRFICVTTSSSCVHVHTQVINFSDRTGRHHLLGLERFADHTGREAWDYSAWVRVYSSYLDERLGAFRCVVVCLYAECDCGWVGKVYLGGSC